MTDAKRLDACLTLLFPGELEERLVDQLLQHSDWVGPFTTHRVDGHGEPNGISRPAEQVRGRAERVRTDILMDARHTDDLLQELRRELPSHEVAWWLTPIVASGRLA